MGQLALSPAGNTVNEALKPIRCQTAQGSGADAGENETVEDAAIFDGRSGFPPLPSRLPPAFQQLADGDRRREGPAGEKGLEFGFDFGFRLAGNPDAPAVDLDRGFPMAETVFANGGHPFPPFGKGVVKVW